MDWRDHAECLGEDPELFHPTTLKGPGRQQAQVAKEVCKHCPVKDACLDWALDCSPAPSGIWGGTDDDERVLILRHRDRTAKRRYFRKDLDQ